jgi:hypothetical protein
VFDVRTNRLRAESPDYVGRNSQAPVEVDRIQTIVKQHQDLRGNLAVRGCGCRLGWSDTPRCAEHRSCWARLNDATKTNEINIMDGDDAALVKIAMWLFLKIVSVRRSRALRCIG